MDDVELEHRLTANEKLAGSNRHRLDAVEERQGNLEKLVSRRGWLELQKRR